MLNQERQDRKMRSRKNSMNINEDAAGSEGQAPDSSNANDEEKEDEFSKPMMYLYDLEELNQRRKE